MKKSSLFSLIISGIFLQVSVSAQPWMKPSITSVRKEVQKPNFYNVQEKFNNYWKDREVSMKEAENAEEGGYEQFKRWEWFMKQRTFPSGQFPQPDILFREYKRYQQTHPVANLRTASPNWSFIGPAVVPGGGGGAGRVNVIRFDPNNSQNIFAGAASGGLWKSTDGGLSWSSNTDLLPALSIADMAINPRNTDTMYIATGDGYGYEYLNDFWGGTYSAGVLMSVDGGVTWNSTGLSYSQSQTDIIQRIVVSPIHPEIVMIATRNGIFRSDDGGATWSLVQSGHYYDIEFNTANADVVYSTDNSSLYRSLDGGQTWSQLYQGLCTGRISIATTAANDNVIYALCETGTFYRSNDGGLSFTQPGSPQTTFYGYYDCVLAASQVDENTIYCGGLGISKSNDGGNSWQSAANNGGGGDYVHADNHFLDFLPGSNTTIFSGNDGGVFKTDDAGSSWTDLSNSLGIKQYYRMGQSSTDPYLIYAGAQDNGTDRLKNGVWEQVSGADGMECLVDYTNDDVVYVSSQNGYVQRSTDGGASFNFIAPGGGAWVTPFIIDPVDPQTLYGGFFDLQKTTDGGSTWNSITSNATFNGDVIAIAISRSNTNVLYAASLGAIFRTDNGGVSWTDISPGLPVNSVGITYIAVCDTNPQKVWVTFTGYSNGEKVYMSTDGGANWNNISGSLPNIPVNCVVYQNQSDDVLYIGTDFGVFYRDSAAVDWIPYNGGLPNVIVSELEIQYSAGKLRAATYGRGIWEADLNGAVPILLDAGISQILSPSGTSCDSVQIPQFKIRNYGSDTLFTANVYYQIDGGAIQLYVWTGVLSRGDEDLITLPAQTFSGGNHVFSVYTSDPNGGTDQYTFNDIRSISFTMNTNQFPIPFTEDFQAVLLPPANWTLNDPSGLLQLDNTTGGFGLSSTSIFANFFYTSSGSVGALSTPQFDLSSALAPAILSFNLAYAPYGTGFEDSLVISVSTDCGNTFNRIYEKGPLDIATTTTNSNVFVPGASEWRRDSIDISSLIGNSGVLFRFDAISGYGNNLYLDDINVSDASTGVNSPVLSDKVMVYPNPVTDVLKIAFNASSGNNYFVRITDVTGRQVMIKEVRSSSGLINTSLDLSGLDAGMYQYSIIKNNSVQHSGKIVKS